MLCSVLLARETVRLGQCAEWRSWGSVLTAVRTVHCLIWGDSRTTSPKDASRSLKIPKSQDEWVVVGIVGERKGADPTNGLYETFAADLGWRETERRPHYYEDWHLQSGIGECLCRHRPL